MKSCLGAGCALFGLLIAFEVGAVVTELIRMGGQINSDAGFSAIDVAGGLVTAGLLTWILVIASRGQREKARIETNHQHALVAEQESEARRLINDARFAPITPHVPDGVLLKHDEICYWTEHAELWSHHTHTVRQGGSMGMSFRVAKGVWIRPGTFQSAPLRQTTLEADDGGLLHVTNQRLLFVGNRSSKEIPVAKIAQFDALTDGLKVSQVNKPVVFFVTGNPLLGIVTPRIASGNVDSQPALPS